MKHLKAKSMGRWLMAVLPLWPLLAGSPARAEESSASIQRQLERGEVVCLWKFQRPLYTFDVFGYVDAQPDEVWRAITTYDRYSEFLPLVTASALRHRKGVTAYQYVEMVPPWPFQHQWFVNANQEDRPHGLVAFKETEGSVKTEYGYWQVTPVTGGRTKLLYHLTADPWISYIPQFVVDHGTHVIFPNVIKGVRKRVVAERLARH